MDNQPSAVSHGATATFNVNYIVSAGGILKILEVFLGLICWSILAANPGAGCSEGCFAGRQFVLFLIITAWILTLILLIIYITALHTSVFSRLPWAVIEFIFNVFWSIVYLIAAAILAADNNGVGSVVASTVFGFFTTVCYIVHAVLSFRDWTGHLPCRSPSSDGNSVPA